MKTHLKEMSYVGFINHLKIKEIAQSTNIRYMPINYKMKLKKNHTR